MTGRAKNDPGAQTRTEGHDEQDHKHMEDQEQCKWTDKDWSCNNGIMTTREDQEQCRRSDKDKESPQTGTSKRRPPTVKRS